LLASALKQPRDSTHLRLYLGGKCVGIGFKRGAGSETLVKAFTVRSSSRSIVQTLTLGGGYEDVFALTFDFDPNDRA
jgi:hypothetical protein